MVLAFLTTKQLNAKFYTLGIISLCCLGFLFVQPQLVHAQSNINYAEIRVDELSDAQIRQLILQAQAFGATDAMVLQQASARGMKPTEVEKLRKRMESVRIKEASLFSYDLKEEKSGKGFDPRMYRDPSYIDSLNTDLDSLSTQIYVSEDYFSSISPQIFGANLFQNSKLKFEPNLQLPTPLDYVIGANDELLIDIMGDNEEHFELNVGPDGYIRLQYVGLVRVGGLTIEQATSKLRQTLSAVYPSMRTNRTQLVIGLGNIRSIQVVVTGEAVKPGTYTLPSLATVFHALYAAGGPSAQGSYRDIRVIRNREIIHSIDLYDFLIHGLQPGFSLRDDDIIHIPVYQQRVSLLGEVKRNAIFEVKAGETLKDVIGFAGGFSENAYMERFSIIRNTAKEKEILNVEGNAIDKFVLYNGDRIQVDGVLDRFENRVMIHGAVFRPGAYGLEEGLTLRGLIEKANGLREDAFKSRGYIYRLNQDMSKSMIAFDIDQLYQQNEADLVLKREDEVVIHSHFDLRETQLISIQGEVRTPGNFEYSAGMSIGEIIQLAGGFKLGASPTRIEVSRRVRNSDALSSNGSTAQIFIIDVDPQLRITSTDFKLEPFDIVTVRSSEGYVAQRQVKIEGEVLYPGYYVIQHKNERLSDLIGRAGGLTSSAYIAGSSLERVRFALENPTHDLFASDVERHLVGIDMEAILKKPGSQIDLLLEQGDVIRVPKLLQTVRVSGEVLNPNAIVYEAGKSLKSYINGAGGFTSKAYKKRVFVRYANGSAKSAKQFLFFRSYPKVLPGSEIVVPTEPERQLFSAQNWVAISSTLASITAIIVTIMR